MFLLLSCLLTALGVAVFPRWRHSARWGYTPSVIVGALLIIVAILAAGGKSTAIDTNSKSANQAQRVVQRIDVTVLQFSDQ